MFACYSVILAPGKCSKSRIEMQKVDFSGNLYSYFEMVKTLRTVLLPLSILLGLLSPWTAEFAGSVKWLLSSMVFLAFVGPTRFSWQTTYKTQLRLLPFWLFLAPVSWLITRTLFPDWPGLSWAVFMVCIAPTATAAPAVVRMSGGDPTLVVTGVVMQHILAGLAIPMWSGVLGGAEMQGWEIPYRIMVGTIPMIVAPLILAFLMRKFWTSLANSLVRIQPINLFLWAIAVFIVVGKARHDFSELGMISEPGAVSQIIAIAICALLFCLLQFYSGYKLVSSIGHGDEGSQIIGQKNTILAIWVASTWFGSWAMLGPLFYILWQNIYIAWRAAHERRIT